MFSLHGWADHFMRNGGRFHLGLTALAGTCLSPRTLIRLRTAVSSGNRRPCKWAASFLVTEPGTALPRFEETSPTERQPAQHLRTGPSGPPHRHRDSPRRPYVNPQSNLLSTLEPTLPTGSVGSAGALSGASPCRHIVRETACPSDPGPAIGRVTCLQVQTRT